MGLDVSHECWSGQYSAFGEWRRAIAEVLGFELNEMRGFGGTRSWSELPPDPLHKLLDHSDCDGSLEHADTLAIAERLEQVAPQLSDVDRPYSWRARAERFASGLRRAHQAGEDVRFG
jgi:hypothetical protein